MQWGWLTGKVGWSPGWDCLALSCEAQLRGREREGSDFTQPCFHSEAFHSEDAGMFSTWTSLLGPRLLSPTAHCPLSVPTGMLYDISSATWSKANSKQGSLIIPSVLSPKPQSHADSSFSHIPHATHSELLLVPPSTCNQTLTTSTNSIASTLVQATVTACLLSALARFTASLHCTQGIL